MSGNYSGATAAAGGMNPARKKVKRKIHPLFSRGVMDLSFFLIIMTLLVIGIIMMFSASYAWALNESGGESGTGSCLPADYNGGDRSRSALLFFIF